MSVVGHRQVVPLAKMLGSHQVVVVENEEPSESVRDELRQQTFPWPSFKGVWCCLDRRMWIWTS